jgi:hypothetical protein
VTGNEEERLGVTASLSADALLSFLDSISRGLPRKPIVIAEVVALPAARFFLVSQDVNCSPWCRTLPSIINCRILDVSCSSDFLTRARDPRNRIIARETFMNAKHFLSE